MRKVNITKRILIKKNTKKKEEKGDKRKKCVDDKSKRKKIKEVKRGGSRKGEVLLSKQLKAKKK